MGYLGNGELRVVFFCRAFPTSTLDLAFGQLWSLVSCFGKWEEVWTGQWKTELHGDWICIMEEEENMNDAFHNSLDMHQIKHDMR